MFIVDDLLFRPFILMLDALHAMAVEEMYDVDGIRDALKENRLLFELGERSEQDYTERKRELENELSIAQQAREQLRGKSIEVAAR